MARFRSCDWLLLSLLAALASRGAIAATPEKPPATTAAVHNILGDYGNELRGADGRVKIEDMVTQLKEMGANTYLWHIWNVPTDWDDLKLFLPKAAQAGIQVWVIVGPATDSSPDGKLAAEPFKGDYTRWAEEIAKLSVAHPNLKAWALDRFSTRYATVLTPDGVREVQAKAKNINPKLSFLVVMGFGDTATWSGSVTPEFVENFQGIVDGVIGMNPRHRDDFDQSWSALNDGPDALPNEIRFPWEKQSKPGDFAMASRTVKVLPGAKHAVHFRERDTFNGQTAGYHFKQLLIDDAVVWEQDVAGGDLDWADVDVDLSEAVKGKSSVTLGLRMFDKKGVGKFVVRWRIADLRAEGLEPAKNLGDPLQWKASKQGAFEIGFGGMPEPGKRRFHLPLIIVTGAESAEIALQAHRDGKCEGVVTNSLPKDPKSLFNDDVRKSFQQPGANK